MTSSSGSLTFRQGLLAITILGMLNVLFIVSRPGASNSCPSLDQLLEARFGAMNDRERAAFLAWTADRGQNVAPGTPSQTAPVRETREPLPDNNLVVESVKSAPTAVAENDAGAGDDGDALVASRERIYELLNVRDAPDPSVVELPSEIPLRAATDKETGYNALLRETFLGVYGVLEHMQKRGELLYWLTEGTLISALRNGVNWDDRDIDFDALFTQLKPGADGQYTLEVGETPREKAVVNLCEKLKARFSDIKFKPECKRGQCVQTMTRDCSKITTRVHRDLNLFVTYIRPGMIAPATIHIYIGLEKPQLKKDAILHVTREGVNEQDAERIRFMTRGPGTWLPQALYWKDIFPLKYGCYYGRRVPVPGDWYKYLRSYEDGAYSQCLLEPIHKRGDAKGWRRARASDETLRYINREMEWLESHQCLTMRESVDKPECKRFRSVITS